MCENSRAEQRGALILISLVKKKGATSVIVRLRRLACLLRQVMHSKRKKTETIRFDIFILIARVRI